MNAEVLNILNELVADNGDIVYDDEAMRCRSCGEMAQNPPYDSISIKHTSECIIVLARNLLKQE
jgi:hypothetical protein